jgi:hypothetical protein
MRKFLAIVLVAVLLLPTFGKVGVWLHYQANLRYYTEVLCRNQDKPELNCDGQCVLAERIAATQPQAPAAPAGHIFQFELSAFVQAANSLCGCVDLLEQNVHRGFFIPFQKPLQVAHSIPFPPPELLM